jgi:hypothetical protein
MGELLKYGLAIGVGFSPFIARYYGKELPPEAGLVGAGILGLVAFQTRSAPVSVASAGLAVSSGYMWYQQRQREQLQAGTPAPVMAA